MKNLPERVFYFQNQLLLKHWQEPNGFKHKIIGDYYKDITKLFDKLIECYISISKEITITETAYIITNQIDLTHTFYLDLKNFISDCRNEMLEQSLVNILDDISTIIEHYNYLLNKE